MIQKGSLICCPTAHLAQEFKSSESLRSLPPPGDATELCVCTSSPVQCRVSQGWASLWLLLTPPAAHICPPYPPLHTQT